MYKQIATFILIAMLSVLAVAQDDYRHSIGTAIPLVGNANVDAYYKWQDEDMVASHAYPDDHLTLLIYVVSPASKPFKSTLLVSQEEVLDADGAPLTVFSLTKETSHQKVDGIKYPKGNLIEAFDIYEYSYRINILHNAEPRLYNLSVSILAPNESGTAEIPVPVGRKDHEPIKVVEPVPLRIPAGGSATTQFEVHNNFPDYDINLIKLSVTDDNNLVKPVEGYAINAPVSHQDHCMTGRISLQGQYPSLFDDLGDSPKLHLTFTYDDHYHHQRPISPAVDLPFRVDYGLGWVYAGALIGGVLGTLLRGKIDAKANIEKVRLPFLERLAASIVLVIAAVTIMHYFGIEVTAKGGSRLLSYGNPLGMAILAFCLGLSDPSVIVKWIRSISNPSTS